MMGELVYEPHFSPLEEPENALAELFIRRRHSDGTLIPREELDTMGGHFFSRMRTTEWMTTFGDLILEEHQRRKEATQQRSLED